MTNMQKTWNVLQAYRSSETCRHLSRCLDEIEQYIEDYIEEEVYSEPLQKLREFIIETNENFWQQYFIEPQKEDAETLRVFLHGDVPACNEKSCNV